MPPGARVLGGSGRPVKPREVCNLPAADRRFRPVLLDFRGAHDHLQRIRPGPSGSRDGCDVGLNDQKGTPMSSFITTDAAAAFLEVMAIDLVLAGDNAIVIGLAAAGLPAERRA